MRLVEYSYTSQKLENFSQTLFLSTKIAATPFINQFSLFWKTPF